MQYALLIYEKPDSYEQFTEEQIQAMHGEYMEISRHPGITGGAQLKPIEMASTVRVKDGEALITDGPFADTKEVFGGYYVLQADTLDEALDLAARIPAARLGGSVEVRPLVEMEP